MDSIKKKMQSLATETERAQVLKKPNKTKTMRNKNKMNRKREKNVLQALCKMCVKEPNKQNKT